jgi:hypothetical protein
VAFLVEPARNTTRRISVADGGPAISTGSACGAAPGHCRGRRCDCPDRSPA